MGATSTGTLPGRVAPLGSTPERSDQGRIRPREASDASTGARTHLRASDVLRVAFLSALSRFQAKLFGRTVRPRSRSPPPATVAPTARAAYPAARQAYPPPVARPLTPPTASTYDPREPVRPVPRPPPPARYERPSIQPPREPLPPPRGALDSISRTNVDRRSPPHPPTNPAARYPSQIGDYQREYDPLGELVSRTFANRWRVLKLQTQVHFHIPSHPQSLNLRQSHTIQRAFLLSELLTLQCRRHQSQRRRRLLAGDRLLRRTLLCPPQRILSRYCRIQIRSHVLTSRAVTTLLPFLPLRPLLPPSSNQLPLSRVTSRGLALLHLPHLELLHRARSRHRS